MTTISGFMSDDHRRCDLLFAKVEEQVANGEWDSADEGFKEMHQAIEHHLAMEEEVLFPAFEGVTGSTMGPTHVMRHEHQQIRQLFDQMEQALASRQTDDYLGASETLLILMQQHNAKEEQILYPMIDAQLAAQSEELLQRMQAL